MSDALPPKQDPSKPLPEQANPSPSQTDEGYSLDEIMRTLRESERKKDEEGEVVTRSDGSTALKVRRRKRRSEQPANSTKDAPEKEKRSLMLKLSLGVGLFLLLLMGALFILVAFNSQSYEEKLEARAAEWSGAEVSLSKLKVLPGSITAKNLDFVWPESSHLTSLKMRDLEGDVKLTTFVGTTLGGQSFGAKSGVLHVHSPAQPESFGKALRPQEFPFGFNRYFCDALDIYFGESSQLQVRKAEVSMRHFLGDGFRVTVGAGELKLKGWQTFQIDTGLVKFSPEAVRIASLRLKSPHVEQFGTQSSLLLSGSVPLKEGERAQLDLSTDSFPMEMMLGDSLGQLFSGVAREVEGVAHYTTGQNRLDEVVLPFKADHIQLRKFPLLEDLKRLFADIKDEDLIFNTDLGGLYRWRPEGSAIEGLTMATKNIRMEGDVLISSAGRIGGQLRVWISMGYINGDSRLKNHPGFAHQEGGYAIVDVILGGTVKMPDDDFRVKTGVEPFLDRKKNTSTKSPKELWEEMQNESGQ